VKIVVSKADNHRAGHEERNNRPIIAYEVNGKYFIGLIAGDGEYIGQMKNFDSNSCSHSAGLAHLKGKSLFELSEAFGSWFTPPLRVFDVREADNIDRGKFYPRVWRPCKFYYEGKVTLWDKSDISDFLIHYDFAAFNQSVVAINGIVRKLKDIFYTVEPVVGNNEVFGHELRNLLILACTEVEAAFKGILTANNYENMGRLSTKDYVKLIDIFSLRNWNANLVFYPDYGLITPFSDWTEDRPTISLPWYDAYNKTKHDRQNDFDKATLKQVINSVCAAVILLHAQYGPRSEFTKLDLADLRISPPVNYPSSDFYIPHFDDVHQDWEMVYLDL
jgi:hypothetical protein